MSVLDAYDEREIATVLVVASVVAAVSWYTAELDPVSRIVTAVLAFVAALVGGAVGFWLAD